MCSCTTLCVHMHTYSTYVRYGTFTSYYKLVLGSLETTEPVSRESRPGLILKSLVINLEISYWDQVLIGCQQSLIEPYPPLMSWCLALRILVTTAAINYAGRMVRYRWIWLRSTLQQSISMIAFPNHWSKILALLMSSHGGTTASQ